MRSARVRTRCMVVEDDPEVRDLIQGMLTSCGYTVVTAEDGIAGLQLLESGVEVDLILTDVVMPKINALALGQQVQQFRRQRLLILERDQKSEDGVF